MEKLEFNIDSSEKSVRIDKYLAECCPDLSRSYLQKLLKDGGVEVAAERWSGFCEYPYC